MNPFFYPTTSNRTAVGEPLANILPQFSLTGPAEDELSLRSDAVLPAQFFHERQGSEALKQFSRLIYAILIDAARCYLEGKKICRRKGKCDQAFASPCR